MSVLIKGMEMPKSCGECLDIGWHYVFECRFDDVEEGERLPNCPLVPVPPHGRLIDADALEKKLSSDIDAYEKSEINPTWNDAVVCVLTMPTVIPADKDGET